ncbi:MAG: lysoplasmalogenase [Christensenellaceae bacterium]|jgi:uncharacterized membrane protein YhhN|nr:lysoplasmalogenase [Christensenellaceae bacterium]
MDLEKIDKIGMILTLIISSISILIILVRLIFVKKANAKSGFVFKFLSSFSFCLAGVIAAFSRGAFNPTFAGSMLIMALILALCGDVILALPHYVAFEYKDLFSAIGGASFLLGHVLYCIVFFSIGSFNYYLLPVIILIPLLYFIINKVKVVNFGKNFPLILGYGSILSALLLATLNLSINGNVAGCFSLAAAVLFILSDSSLFLYTFGCKEFMKGKAIVWLIFLPYYLAQALFVFSILVI